MRRLELCERGKGAGQKVYRICMALVGYVLRITYTLNRQRCMLLEEYMHEDSFPSLTLGRNSRTCLLQIKVTVRLGPFGMTQMEGTSCFENLGSSISIYLDISSFTLSFVLASLNSVTTTSTLLD